MAVAVVGSYCLEQDSMNEVFQNSQFNGQLSRTWYMRVVNHNKMFDGAAEQAGTWSTALEAAVLWTAFELTAFGTRAARSS